MAPMPSGRITHAGWRLGRRSRNQLFEEVIGNGDHVLVIACFRARGRSSGVRVAERLSTRSTRSATARIVRMDEFHRAVRSPRRRRAAGVAPPSVQVCGVVGPPRKLSLVRPFQDLDGVGVRRFWGPQGQLGSGSHQRPLAFRGNVFPPVGTYLVGITGLSLGRRAGRRGDVTPRNGTGVPAPPLLHRSPILGKGDPPLWEHPRGAAGAHASKDTAAHQFMSTGSSRRSAFMSSAAFGLRVSRRKASRRVARRCAARASRRRQSCCASGSAHVSSTWPWPSRASSHARARMSCWCR